MKTTKNLLKLTEVLLISFVWIVLIATPVLFSKEDFEINALLRPLDIYIPLAILFILNRFLLVPSLLFRGKLGYYILSIISVIVLFTSGSYIYQSTIGKDMHRKEVIQNSISPLENRTGARPDQPGFPPPGRPKAPQPVPPFANLMIFSLLLVGFDTGLSASFKWAETEKFKARLEKENVTNQLNFLRNQVNPHFFMNTLNNIHALIDISGEKAKDAVIQLSKMMRYLIYETGHDATPLKKEIEFIESYIDLMRLRVSEKVTITVRFPSDIPNKSIPPFLFTSFIENAFKHGISYQKISFVDIQITLTESRLHFIIINSKAQNGFQKEDGGIGIENVVKRLDLLYAHNYKLELIDKEDVFTVNLSIPI